MTKIDQYVADAPLKVRERDTLKRWPFAQRVADTLATRSDPTSLVVGIYGRWGEGKTTVLEFVEQRLNEHDDVIVVRFNPWLFTSDRELFIGFFEQVATALDAKLTTTTEKIGAVLRKYGGLVAGLSFAVGPLTGGAGSAIADAGEQMTKVTPAELRERLEKCLEAAKKRVVVLVDDIDRLDKNEAQAVFRLLKVAADFRWTSYVLAFDREIVADALAERYPKRPDGGDEFLDKIVQVPLPLPPVPTGTLRKLLVDDLNRVLDESKIALTDEQAGRFMSKFDAGVMEHVETPRAAKRYVNALQFVLPLLRGEVEVVDLMLIEALRVFHPKLYAAILRNRDLLVSNTQYQPKEDIEAARRDLDSAFSPGRRGSGERRVLEDLLPRAKAGAGFHDSMRTAWAREKRITSERYFDRYFASGVPAGDIADEAIRELVTASASDAEKAAATLRLHLADAHADNVIQKLFDLAGSASGAVAVSLARVVARVGSAFPHVAGGMNEIFAPRGRAALLTSKLVLHVDAPRIDGIAEILAAADVPFALQVFRRLRPAEAGEEERANALTESDWLDIGRRLLVRVRAEAEKGWLLDLGLDEASVRFSLWRLVGEEAVLRAYVERGITEHPQRALEVVRMFCRTAWNVGTGARIQEHMRAEEYDRLKQFMDLTPVVAALTNMFGLPAAVDEDGWRDARTDAELAHGFLRLHGQATTAAPVAPAESADVATEGPAS